MSMALDAPMEQVIPPQFETLASQPPTQDPQTIRPFDPILQATAVSANSAASTPPPQSMSRSLSDSQVIPSITHSQQIQDSSLISSTSFQTPEAFAQLPTPPNLLRSSSAAETPPCTLTASSISSTRRPRVTMGPRADCLKCQQGIKDHWIHFV